MSEMRRSGAQGVGWTERRGTRGCEAIAGVRGLLARGAEGVTSLVHALLAREFSRGWTRI